MDKDKLISVLELMLEEQQQKLDLLVQQRSLTQGAVYFLREEINKIKDEITPKALNSDEVFEIDKKYIEEDPSYIKQSFQ